MITAADLFYNFEDVMQILDYSRPQAYKIIAKLNGELQKQGYEVRPGLVSQRYFNKRYFIIEKETKAGKNSARK